MASPEGFIASVEMWPLNWAPRNWAVCNGMLLNVRDFEALFSLLGTTYGGDGYTTFGVPDMRDRIPIGAFGKRIVSQRGGHEYITLTTENLPSHTHVAAGMAQPKAFTGKGTLTSDPTNNYPGAPSTAIYGSTPNTEMGSSPITVAIQNAGEINHFRLHHLIWLLIS